MKRISESDIKRIVKKVINEDDTFVTGIAASERTELVEIMDPHIDGKDLFEREFDLIDGENVFFIGTQHDLFRSLKFPKNSIVIDPFRYMPDQENSKLIKIGFNE